MSEDQLSSESPKQEGAPPWMATFGDMMSLLLCFFVLLLSFANMDIIKFRDMMGSMKDAFGVQVQEPGDFEEASGSIIDLEETPETTPVEPNSPPVPSSSNRKMDLELLEKINHFIGERRLAGVVEAVPGEKGVTIRIKGTLLFEAASDKLRTRALPILDEIGKLASLFPHELAVQGHTDDVPIHTIRFPSNWELSTARAVAGVRYLIDEGHVQAERISASGFAHTRPLTSEKTPEAKAQNRRIEFIFYHDQESTPNQIGSKSIQQELEQVAPHLEQDLAQNP
jgi:chemotaxis protein MotB